MRTLEFAGGPRVGLRGSNASVFYAKHWLNEIGIGAAPEETLESPVVVIAAGQPGEELASITRPDTDISLVTLWDFQIGKCGNGLHAAAAAGVSWVIGHKDGPPLALPINVPEKWCGLMGANMALGTLMEVSLQGTVAPRRVDISAADTLRSFADQNSGNHAEIDSGWSRNGSTAVEHGGIFPQGYFACRDGYVGVVGRSRRDWVAIRDVIEWPEWSHEERFEDPFVLAENSQEIDVLLAEALTNFDRDDLLQRALKKGAPLAPVYTADELAGRNVVRQDFFAEDGSTKLPFEIVSRSA
jgi:crotonobetainyl-CoA:carnitine CoA-transferase CaiB-like acyl-CoA transferase